MDLRARVSVERENGEHAYFEHRRCACRQMVMSLPMTKQEFTEEKQMKFRVSIATAGGVTPGDVTMDKIETIMSRRGSDHHLLIFFIFSL
jgi:hypothetical protein